MIIIVPSRCSAETVSCLTGFSASCSLIYSDGICKLFTTLGISEGSELSPRLQTMHIKDHEKLMENLLLTAFVWKSAECQYLPACEMWPNGWGWKLKLQERERESWSWKFQTMHIKLQIHQQALCSHGLQDDHPSHPSLLHIFLKTCTIFVVLLHIAVPSVICQQAFQKHNFPPLQALCFQKVCQLFFIWYRRVSSGCLLRITGIFFKGKEHD